MSALIASATIILGLVPVRAYAAASDHTREEAVAYLNSLVGQLLDDPREGLGDGDADCPDVAKHYYEWLGVGAMGGNGCDYATGNLPSGWTRVYSDPQPGDVAAWDSYHNVSTVYGHVACVVDVDDTYIYTVEESSNQPSRPCFNNRWRISSPSSYLRPNFKEIPKPLPDYDYGSKVTLPEGDGEYTVASVVDSRYVLEVCGGSADAGANVQLYGTNGTAAQRWRFTVNGDGTYTIANARSDLCLDVDDASMEAGANVKQWQWNGGDAQKWWVEDCGDGTYALKAVHSNGFLDVKDTVAGNGTNVQQWYGNGNEAQRWLISRCDGSLVEYLPEGDGEYTVASASDPRLFLDVASGSVDNGANVQIYGANGTAAQRWTFARNDDGTYTILNKKSGKALDVAERSCLDETNVQQWEDGKGLHQKWWVEDCGDGTFCVRSVRSGRCLDVRNGVASSGSNVQQYRSNGSAAQRWLISKCAGALTSLPTNDGVYTVSVASEPSLRLDVCAGSVDDGANVQICEANASDAQRFAFVRNEDGSYLIRNKKSGKLLDVCDMSKVDGANVQQWGDGYNVHRSWWLEDLGDGSYAIRAVHSGRCLEVDGGRLVSGTNVQQYRWNGTAAQRWVIGRVDEEPPVISDVRVSDVSSEGYTVSCTVTDDVGVTRVTFPTLMFVGGWMVEGGQDDILLGYQYDDAYLGTRDGDTWSFRVNISDYGGMAGQYCTHVYAWDAAGNVAKVDEGVSTSVDVPESLPDLSRDGWVPLPGGKKGYARNGKLVTGWLTLGDAKYWFDDKGVMATGWTDVVVDGKDMHYYFNPASGNLARGTWMEIDGKKYYFRPSGNAAHGWATIKDNGVDKKYYFDDDFQMVTGWRDIEVDGKVLHYYFRPSGSMATGWATIDGEKYWFRPSGNMATGWADVDDAYKRYFDDQGHMLTGWQEIGGKTYYFRPSGAMQTGEKVIDGTTYVFSDKGVLVG